VIKEVVLITGDREWGTVEEEKVIRTALESVPVPSLIIHGKARGVDKMAAAVAVDLGHYVAEVPALWDRDGRGAGPIRNKVMVEMLTLMELRAPDVFVYAFHDNIAESKGTKDCVNRAIKAGIVVHLFTRNGNPVEVMGQID